MYCVEEVDNGNDLFGLVLEDATALTAESRSGLLDGVTVLTAQAANAVDGKPVLLKAIPYYAWCNRGDGKMNVWLARSADRAASLKKQAE